MPALLVASPSCLHLSTGAGACIGDGALPRVPVASCSCGNFVRWVLAPAWGPSESPTRGGTPRRPRRVSSGLAVVAGLGRPGSLLFRRLLRARLAGGDDAG